MHYQYIQHLYHRASFGVVPRTLQMLTSQDRSQVVESLFNDCKYINPLQIDLSEFDGIDPKALYKNKKALKEFSSRNSELVKDFNFTWIQRLMSTEANLRERMTLFWTNHFVCKESRATYVQQYNHTLRVNALGHFGDFVKAISKEPAMIKYLNSNQNRKSKPNENFARELMELFMLGEGQYTEKDIKESARAFTGYNHNFEGDFLLRRLLHDYGEKTFFGQTGNFDGDDIIDIILEEKQCAIFICTKIYKYFVNPEINLSHINEMVSVFYPNYNIESLMRFVFMSDWFYDSKNIGVKIKSPIDYIVGISKVVPFAFKEKADAIKVQHVLGQTLLKPPNVAGWKGDTAWIDANTIMVRLKLPSLLLNNGSISLKGKGDFNDNFRRHYFKHNKDKLPFKTNPDWNTFYKNFDTVTIERLPNYIIGGYFNKGTRSYIDTLGKTSKQDFCIQLMSLPEYQMC